MVSGTKSKQATSSVTTGAPPPSTTGGTEGPGAAEGATDLAALKGSQEAPAPEDHLAAGKAARLVQEKVGERHVSDDDAREASAALAKLPPGQARAVLEALQKSGALNELAKQLPDDARRQLVDTMIRAGFIGSDAGRVTGGSKALAPPQAPALACHKSDLSPELRSMLRDENLHRLRSFEEAFTEYRADYQKAVRGVDSFEELRALGPIAEPDLPIWEPGTGKSDKDHEWSRLAAFKLDKDTAAIVTDAVYRLNGRQAPGTDFVIEATVKWSAPGGVMGAEAKLSHQESRDGSSEQELVIKNNIALRTPLGPKVTIERELSHKAVDGKTEGHKENVKVGITADAGKGGAGVVTDGKSVAIKAKTPAGEVSLAVDDDGAKLEVELEEGVSGSVSKKTTRDEHGRETTTLKGSAGVGGASVTAGVDSHGGVIACVGYEKELEDLGLELSAEAELTMQLHTVKEYATAFASIEGTPFSNPPPELARGVRWERLSEAQQAAYAMYGWGKARWQSAQKSANLVASARSVGR